jgi:hypothetical protein
LGWISNALVKQYEIGVVGKMWRVEEFVRKMGAVGFE